MALWSWSCSTWMSLLLVLSLSLLRGGFATVPSANTNADGKALISCLRGSGVKNFSRATSSKEYDSLLKFSLQNLRYAEPGVHKPYAVIVPEETEQVQKAVECSIKNGWEIRVRSGGHSYEGLSSTSSSPNFVVIDLMKLDGIQVDMKSKTAWVEAGATVGQLYAAIADKTRDYGFPAGVCPTMGVGGHFSGGGLGLLVRKYGLSADQVVDATLVDADAKVVDRKGMGEDVFWALRGGGGGSWGVVVAWKIQLVKVPHKITAFNVQRSGENEVTKLVNRWQSVASSVDEDLFIRALVFGGKPEVKLQFGGMYLGPVDHLLQLVNKVFPEMGLLARDCNETDWFGSVVFTAVSNGYSADLRNRYLASKTYFKMKSDFVSKPISPSGLAGGWKMMEEQPNSIMILAPLGGIMNRIPSHQTPYSHRAGYLYDIQYVLNWNDSSNDAKSLDWMKKFYNYMTPYVSKSPRAAYVNYLDLDLGSNTDTHGKRKASATVEEARSWGEKYFGPNFERLVQIKTKFDPNNVFRNAQSIPVDLKSN